VGKEEYVREDCEVGPEERALGTECGRFVQTFFFGSFLSTFDVILP
jgi:hypothetical protein